jgi:hypothetical protein
MKRNEKEGRGRRTGPLGESSENSACLGLALAPLPMGMLGAVLGRKEVRRGERAGRAGGSGLGLRAWAALSSSGWSLFVGEGCCCCWVVEEVEGIMGGGGRGEAGDFWSRRGMVAAPSVEDLCRDLVRARRRTTAFASSSAAAAWVGDLGGKWNGWVGERRDMVVVSGRRGRGGMHRRGSVGRRPRSTLKMRFLRDPAHGDGTRA